MTSRSNQLIEAIVAVECILLFEVLVVDLFGMFLCLVRIDLHSPTSIKLLNEFFLPFLGYFSVECVWSLLSIVCLLVFQEPLITLNSVDVFFRFLRLEVFLFESLLQLISISLLLLQSSEVPLN